MILGFEIMVHSEFQIAFFENQSMKEKHMSTLFRQCQFGLWSEWRTTFAFLLWNMSVKLYRGF